MELIDISKLKWGTAQKTMPIMARPLITLLNDPIISSKLLLRTLEGLQALKEDAMVCIGLSLEDPWQQSAEKLLKKYTVTSISNGWMICTPNPDVMVNVSQVLDESGDTFPRAIGIRAQWGEDDGDGHYIQKGSIGDYILQSQTDSTDVWIVRKSFFEATYEMVSYAVVDRHHDTVANNI